MPEEDGSEMAIALPGEWVLKKTFGPALTEIGEDLKKVYSKGRDKILIAGYKKIKDKDDGKKANLRVARDVFWNGSFTDEAICAEYFGGILASSRSADGTDDSGIYYADLIKSLSSKQLLLHYIIYSSLNKTLTANEKKKDLNPSQASSLQKENLFLFTAEVIELIEDEDIGRHLHALDGKGLLGNFETDNYTMKNGKEVHRLKVSPSSLGIQLYAVAHNQLEHWREFATLKLEEFDEITLPKFYSDSMQKLLKSANMED